jgi:DNA-binding PadR family transcriptional regulator
MAREDPQAFLPLKTNWFHILLCLATEDQHGYGIMQEVLDRTGGKVHLWPATIYGTLARLIEAGLIQESEERPAEELDDARRRYYRLTRLGRLVLDLESQRLEDLVNVLRAKRRLVKRRQEVYE